MNNTKNSIGIDCLFFFFFFPLSLSKSTGNQILTGTRRKYLLYLTLRRNNRGCNMRDLSLEQASGKIILIPYEASGGFVESHIFVIIPSL